MFASIFLYQWRTRGMYHKAKTFAQFCLRSVLVAIKFLRDSFFTATAKQARDPGRWGDSPCLPESEAVFGFRRPTCSDDNSNEWNNQRQFLSSQVPCVKFRQKNLNVKPTLFDFYCKYKGPLYGTAILVRLGPFSTGKVCASKFLKSILKYKLKIYWDFDTFRDFWSISQWHRCEIFF